MKMTSNNCSCDDHSMADHMMTFHFDASLRLLFRSWNINSPGDLVGAIVVVFVVAVLYEGLKTLREYLLYLDMRRPTTAQLANKHTDLDNFQLVPTENQPINRKQSAGTSRGLTYFSISVSMHLVQSALHVVQVGTGYLLMLVAMTFNGWLFLAICFGAGVGYLLFAKTRHALGMFREQNETHH